MCWITKSRQVHKMLLAKSLPCEYLYSFRGMYTVLRAQYSVLSYRLSDIQEGLIGGSNIVQLWHGIPIRKIGFNGDWSIHSLLGRVKRVIYSKLPYTYYMSCDVLFSSNKYTTRAFAEAFKYSFRKNAQIIEVPQPRYDYLLETIDFQQIFTEEESFIKRHKKGFNKAIVWMPTHRFFQRKSFLDIISEYKIELKELSNWLVANNYVLFFKLHPIEINSLSKIGSHKNFVFYNFIESAPLVKLCDTLITDYSSIAFDFIALEKPVIFFAPDLDDYTRHTGFYLNYYEEFEHTMCSTIEGLFALFAESLVIESESLIIRLNKGSSYSEEIHGLMVGQ